LQEGHAKGALEAKFEWGGDWALRTKHIFRRNSKTSDGASVSAKVKAFYMEPDRSGRS